MPHMTCRHKSLALIDIVNSTLYFGSGMCAQRLAFRMSEAQLPRLVARIHSLFDKSNDRPGRCRYNLKLLIENNCNHIQHIYP
jgi:hypothetical protein